MNSAGLPDHPALLGLYDHEALAAALEEQRGQGRLIVFTNGCFDLLHPGHVDLLCRARELGQLLVVGLNSDASVRSLGKGPGRPVTPLAHRAFVLAHLSCVDYVAAFEQATPLELIAKLQPDVLVKGGDWPVERIVGREIVQERGGAVYSLPLLPGFSTTALIERMGKVAAQTPGNKQPS